MVMKQMRMKHQQLKQQSSWKVRSALTVFCLLTACAGTPNKAPVIDRSKELATPEAEKVSVAPAENNTPTETRASYTVKKGDTLLRIAFEHGQSYRDIVAWNNLKNPDDIKVDQVLWIGSPEGSSGAKTSPVQINLGSEVRNLTPINPSTNKSLPKGDKRPYSESNLAEMQKNEAIAAAAIAAKAESSLPKPNEKLATGNGVETIDWIWPSGGKLLASFEETKNKGIELNGRAGQDVLAVAAGKVIYEGGAMRGYGNMLIIKHANNYLSAYAHNKVNLVKEGQPVAKGQKIAEMGNTDSDVVKLHFEIRQAGKPVDPVKLLPGR